MMALKTCFLIGLLTVLVGTGILFIAHSSAEFNADTYLIGDVVKLKTPYAQYTLKITTPSKSYIYHGGDSELVFKPEELGIYRAQFSDGGEITSYSFTVIDSESVITNESTPTALNHLFEEAKREKTAVAGMPVLHQIIQPNTNAISIPSSATNIAAYYTSTDGSVHTLDYDRIVSDSTKQVEQVTFESVSADEVLLQYYTEAPKLTERTVASLHKEVIVSAPETLVYSNVYAYTTIPEYTDNPAHIKVYSEREARYIVPTVLDSDDDGLLDYVSWVIPELFSNNAYQVIIEISEAQHLDNEREFIADVYREVSALDGVLIEIPANDFVRVVFEQPLTDTNDITLYAESVEGATVEVYERDSDTLLATFPTITERDYYTIFLQALTKPQDAFDLKVIGGSILFDLIIDPFAPDNLPVAQIYQTILNDDVDTETSIRFDQETVLFSDFSHGTTSELTVNNPGWYKVSYACTFRELAGNGRRIVTSWIEQDSVEVVPSRTYCYVRQTGDDGDRCSTQGVMLVNVSEGAVLTLQSSTVGGGSGTDITSEESCWLYTEKVSRPVAQVYETNDGDGTLDTIVHITQDFGATTYVDDDQFTIDLTNNWISVDEDGLYKIYYVGTSQKQVGTNDNERLNPSSYLYLDNSTQLNPSLVYSWHKRVDEANISSEQGFTMANLSAGQNISLRRFLAAGDLSNPPITRRESWLFMEKVDDNALLLWDSSGGQTSSADGSFDVNITWNEQEVVGSNFSHTPGSAFFTIDENGLFEISYAVGWDDGGNGNRFIACARVIRDGVPLEPSTLCDYTRGNNEARYGTVAGTFIVNNTAGSEYAVQWSGNSHVEDLEPASSWINVIPVKLDTTPPLVTVTSPLSQPYGLSSFPLSINVTLNEDGGNVLYSLDDGITNTSLSTIDSQAYNATIPSLSEGAHNLSIYAQDVFGNQNNTVQVSFSVDLTAPSVILTLPENKTYATSSLEINYSATDNLLDSCWYSDDQGVTNITLGGCTNTTYSASEGSTTILLYANDSVGNLNATSVTFFVDSINPLITLGNGVLSSGANVTTNSIYVNVSVTELNEANISFSLFNGGIVVNQTTYSAGRRTINWTNLNDGIYEYNVTIRDVSSNFNVTGTRLITLDTTGPLITINEPVNTKTYAYNTSLIVNATVTDSLMDVEACWWNLDHGVNQSILCNSITTFNTTEGTHVLYYFANDTLGNFNVRNSTFAIFTQGPAVNLDSPNDGVYINQSGITTLSYSAIGPLGISSCDLYGDFNGNWELNQSQRLDWWNESWEYREKLNITAGSNVTDDYTVDIVIDTTGSQFLDNGDDLRVVYNNGTEFIELNRLLVRPNTTTTQIQFKLQENITGGSSDSEYSFYYGNPSAINPPANATDVWLFYDDFSQGNLDNWAYGTGTSVIDTGYTNPWTGVDSVLNIGGACGNAVLKVSDSVFTPARDLKIRALWLDNPGLACSGGSPDADGVLGIRGSSTTTYDGILLEWDTDTGFHYDSGATGSVNGDFVPFEEWIWTESVAFGTDPADHQAKHWNFTEVEPTTYSLTASSVSWTTPGLPYLRTASGTALVAVVFASIKVENEPVVTVQEEEWLGSYNVTLTEDREYNWNVLCYDRNGAGAFAVKNYSFIIDTLYPQIIYSPPLVADDTEDRFGFEGSPTNATQAVDEDLATYTILNSDPDIDVLYINYTTPGIAVQSATLQYLTDWNVAAGRIGCYNYTSDMWSPFITMADNVLTNATIPSECFIGETVLQLRAYRSLSLAFGNVNFYDELVYWNVIPTDANGIIASKDNIFVNVFVEEENDANVTFSLFNETELLNEITSESGRSYNWTGLADGTYYYNVTVVDYTNRVNSTATRNITLDTTLPSGTILYPNGTYNSTTTQNLTINASDGYGLSNATLYIYNETGDLINQTTVEVSGIEVLIGIVYEFLTDGIFTWFYELFDLAGNSVISENTTIIIDTTLPTVAFGLGTPGNNTLLEQTSIFVNVSLEEINFDYISYTLYNITGGILNQTNYTNAVVAINWTLLNGGNVTYEYDVRVQDLAGNSGTSERRTITLIDTQNPLLTLYDPQNTTYTTSQNLPLRLGVADANLDSCWYSLDGNVNTTISGCANTTFSTSDGVHTLYVYANDSLNQLNMSSVSFTTNSTLIITDDWLVQRGESVVSGLSTELLETPVDSNKAFITFTTRGSSSAPSALQVTSRFSNSEAIELENYAGASVNVAWEVITGPSLDVQRGEVVYGDADSVITVPIPTAVNLSNSFILVGGRTSSGTAADNDAGYWRGRFFNETALTFERGNNGISGNISWQVVSWEGATVQNGSVSTGATSASATLNSSVNLSRSFLVFSTGVTSGGLDDTVLGGYFIDDSTLGFYREGNGATADIDWYVIETAEVLVQEGNYLATGSAPIDVSITPVASTGRTFHRSSHSSTGGGTTFANSVVTSELLNATSVRLTKGTANQNNNVSWRIVELLDTIPPSVTLVDPVDSFLVAGTSIGPFAFTANDTASSLAQCDLYGDWNGGWHLNQSLLNPAEGDNNYTNVSIFTDGTYLWNVICYDVYGNAGTASANYSFSLDSTFPLVAYGIGTLADGLNVSLTSIYVNVSVTEVNEAGVTFTLFNSTGLVNQSVYPAGQRTVNWTGLPDETYYYNVSVVDVAGNENTTTTRSITLDITAPSVDVLTPANGTYNSTTTQNLTINASDGYGLSNATLYIYNETGDLINQTTVEVSGTEVLIGIVYEFLTDGIFTWFYELFDLAGNSVISENTTIIIDTLTPLISFGEGIVSDGGNVSATSIFVNVTFTEINFANITYSLYTGAGLYDQTTSTSELTSTSFTGLSDGVYYYNVSLYDLAGNSNATQTRTILLDTTPPVVDIVHPAGSEVFGTNISLELNTTASDALIGLDSCWWSIDGGPNMSLGCGVNATFNTSVGAHTIRYYANDSIGNLASDSVLFSVSIGGPAIFLNSPVDDSFITSTQPISFNYTAADPQGVDSCSLYGDFSGSWLLNQTNTTVLDGNSSIFLVTLNNDGDYSWNVFCNDTLDFGAYAGSNNTFTIDRTHPSLLYGVGTLGDGVNVSADSVYVNVSVVEANEANIRFRLFNLTGLVNQTTYPAGQRTVNWTGLPDTTYFYDVLVTDEGGLSNSTIARRITLDTMVPTISYGVGTLGDGVNVSADSVYVNVSVVEANEANITFVLYNVTSLINESVYVTAQRAINWTGLADGTYYYNVSIYDIVTQFNTTLTRQVTLDTQGPTVTLLYPSAGSNISDATIAFNYTVSDNLVVDNCTLYGNWSGAYGANQTHVAPSVDSNLSFDAVSLTIDAYYEWNVLCIDSANNQALGGANASFALFAPPEAPRIVNVSQDDAAGQGGITLNWSFANHSLLYRVYSSDDYMGAFSLLAETPNLTYTDTSFSGSTRRYYVVESFNPVGQNQTTDVIGAHVYSLGHNANTRNWISFPSNASYIVSASDILANIFNTTAVSTWNATTQQRVTCNGFSCPTFPSCTDTTCDFTVEGGAGYELNVNSSAPTAYNWSVVGLVYSPATLSLLKNTTDFGKNWIALNPNTTLSNAQGLIENISSADAVSRWNSAQQTSQGLIPSPFGFGPPYLGTNFDIVIEQGYEVSVTEDSNWTQV